MASTTPGRFDEAIALPTGGGSGIGATVVRRPDTEGTSVIHVADVDLKERGRPPPGGSGCLWCRTHGPPAPPTADAGRLIHDDSPQWARTRSGYPSCFTRDSRAP